MIENRLHEPMLFSGACNATIFNHWLEHRLCPLLTENHVVVIDNAAFHKLQKTKDLIEKTGAILLFLPPYSPDLMPIENTFGSMKQHRQFNPHLSIDQVVCAFS